MGYIRFIITAVTLVFFFIVGIPAGIIFQIIGLIDKDKKDAMSAAFVRWGLSMVGVTAGGKVKIIDREKLRTGEATMFVANHSSIFDLVYCLAVLPDVTAVVAKKELAKIPFLHYWMTQIHCIFLDRSNIESGVQMVKDAAELLKSGKNVLIFPEGTRTKTEGELLEFHGGSFKIAIRTNAPIVPISIIGTGDVFETHFPEIHASNITLVVGDAIPTKGMPIPERKKLPENCRQIITNNYEKYNERA